MFGICALILIQFLSCKWNAAPLLLLLLLIVALVFVTTINCTVHVQQKLLLHYCWKCAMIVSMVQQLNCNWLIVFVWQMVTKKCGKGFIFLLNFEIRELSTHVMMVLRVKEKGIDLVSYDVNDKLLYKPQRLNHRSTQNLQLNKINT